MATLIDSSVWINFTRKNSPKSLKEFIAPYVLHPNARMAEPVMFELLRHATPKEAEHLSDTFSTFPLLPTPSDIWQQAARLGQTCRQKGFTAKSLDLLIATVSLHHQATVLTFVNDFRKISDATGLKVDVLSFPPDLS